MLRLVIVIVVAACVTAEENRWVWGKNQRNQRAFSNEQGDKYGNNFYNREKDREPTTRRPTTGQPSEEDFINPDELRQFNGPPNFGYPPLIPGAPVNNYPSGFATPNVVNSPQGYPNNGYPVPSGPGQANYPTAPGGFGGGYPPPVAGGYPQVPNNGYPPQGGQGYPNQGPMQGFPVSGPFPAPVNAGFSGFGGYPGIGNIFGLGGQGGYPAQGQIPGQGLAPNLSGNIAGQGGYPLPGFGPIPYPIQGGAYPNQPGQYPPGVNYPQQGGQYPTGQYVGCGQFGGNPCAGGQLGQYPGQYPNAYPGQYQPGPYSQGQYPPGQYPQGQYPFPDPYSPYNNNPYGITPYNRGSGYASAFDDYDEASKNGTNGTNRALKPEGKSFNTSSPVPRSTDKIIHKKV